MTIYAVETSQRFAVTFEVEADSPEAAWIAVLDNDSNLEAYSQWPCEIIDSFADASITEVAE